jgi:subtilisin family serine protease
MEGNHLSRIFFLLVAVGAAGFSARADDDELLIYLPRNQARIVSAPEASRHSVRAAEISQAKTRLLNQDLRGRRYSSVKHLDQVGVTRIRVKREDKDAILNDLVRQGYVVEPNRSIHIQSFDTVQSHNWGFQYSNAPGVKYPDVHQAENTVMPFRRKITVAVIDSGLDYNHPDIAPYVWSNSGEVTGNGIDDDHNGYVDDTRGYDFVGHDNNPMDQNGHGTHVAGLIIHSAQWGEVSPVRVEIMPLRFLDSSGDGSIGDAIAAIDYAVSKGVKLMNLSWGGSGYSDTLQHVMDDTYNQGVLYVVAAGNENSDNDITMTYPGSFNLLHEITVAATTRFNDIWSYSNFGATSVGIGAPGEQIYSTYLNGGYAYMDGTSQAAPYVTAAAALIWSTKPDLNSVQVKEAILQSATSMTALRGRVSSNGRLDAYGAVARASGMQPAPLPQYVTRSPASGGMSCGSVEAFRAVRETDYSNYAANLAVLGMMVVSWLLVRYLAKRDVFYHARQRYGFAGDIVVRYGKAEALGEGVDISRKGIGLTVRDRKLTTGDLIGLEIASPRGPILVRGRVTWVNDVSGRAGVVFEDLEPAVRRQLDAVLSSLA